MNKINISRVAFAALLLLSLTLGGCKKDNDDMNKQSSAELESFMATEELGAIVEGESYAIDPTTDQIVSTFERDLYSVSNCDYTKFYTLTIEGDIAYKNKLTVECAVENYVGVKPGTFAMEVVKVDNDTDTFWLWSQEDEVGFVLKFY
ncbi:MAG: hypothetical protein R3Y08_06370 [Rikenellaceae bacterium]